VDGGTSNLTGKITKKFANILSIKVIKQQKSGLAYARNLGWRNAEGKILTFIDDDVIVTPQWLREVVNTFKLYELVGGVTGPAIIPKSVAKMRDLIKFQHIFIYESKKKLFWDLISSIYVKVILGGHPNKIGHIFGSGAFVPSTMNPSYIKLNKPIEVEILEACNMSFRSTLIKRLGGFNEHYIIDWSEPDLCFRMRVLGYKLLFNPKAIVYHIVSPSGGAIRTNFYLRMKDFIHFYVKNYKYIEPNSKDKLLRFITHLSFITGYYVYKLLKS